MSALPLTITTPEISLAGTSTPITLVQIVAPANQRLKVREWSVSFQGVSNTAQPALVRLLFQTTAGTMTANNPALFDSSMSESPQSTGQRTATAEPTAGTVLMEENVHPQTGYTWQAPFGGEVIVGGGKRLGIDCNIAAATTVVARMLFEE